LLLCNNPANGQSGRITPSDSALREHRLEAILQGDSLYGRVKDGITKADFELDFSIDEKTVFTFDSVTGMVTVTTGDGQQHQLQNSVISSEFTEKGDVDSGEDDMDELQYTVIADADRQFAQTETENTNDPSTKNTETPTILFSRADDPYSMYGYDDMNLGEKSATGHHICMKDNSVTHIKVWTENLKNPENLFFKSENGTIMLNKPDKIKGAFFHLEIISTVEQSNPVKVEALYDDGDSKEQRLGNFYVHVFAEITLSTDIYHYGIKTINVKMIENEANKLLKSGVVKLEINNYIRLQNNYDHNHNGKLDYYANAIGTEGNTEVDEALKGLLQEAIVVFDSGFNFSFKISGSIKQGDRQIRVPKATSIKTSTLYTLVNPTSGKEEQFYVTKIDRTNMTLDVRMAKKDRPVPESEDRGFEYEHAVNNRGDDPYILEFSPAGLASSPVITENNMLYVICHNTA
jgi:hypothetical protein